MLADYVRLVVAPLGEAMLHAKVAAIETRINMHLDIEQHGLSGSYRICE